MKSPSEQGALTHLNEQGRARMVNVGQKSVTERRAIAAGEIVMLPETIEKIRGGWLAKGDVVHVAQVAGIMGAKRTSELIPMCHNILISGCDLDFVLGEDRVLIQATLATTGQTGIEMEALTAVATAALTIYDMCKAVDRTMNIQNIRLLKKTGGRSGDWEAPEETDRREREEPKVTETKGIVKAVNISAEKGVVKTPVASIRLIPGQGVEGDAHAAPGNRQVSLLAQESVDKMKRQTGAEHLCVGIFAENITTEGLALAALPIGTKLKIGEALAEISQIGKDCHAGCAIMQKVGTCIMPKEGVFVRVLEGGTVKAGDTIAVIG